MCNAAVYHRTCARLDPAWIRACDALACGFANLARALRVRVGFVHLERCIETFYFHNTIDFTILTLNKQAIFQSNSQSCTINSTIENFGPTYAKKQFLGQPI